MEKLAEKLFRWNFYSKLLLFFFRCINCKFNSFKRFEWFQHAATHVIRCCIEWALTERNRTERRREKLMLRRYWPLGWKPKSPGAVAIELERGKQTYDSMGVGCEVRVDEGPGTWFRRIFPIEKDDLSSRTFHRNIEYDKIISRHPSSTTRPSPFLPAWPTASPFCGSASKRPCLMYRTDR